MQSPRGGCKPPLLGLQTEILSAFRSIASLRLSVLVESELIRGATLKRRSDPKAADALQKWIARLTNLYGDRILPVTLEIAEEWGRYSALRPLPPEDALMAATAHVHRLTLVTRNVKNVEGLGVSLLSPWS